MNCPDCKCLVENHLSWIGCTTIAGYDAEGGPVLCFCRRGESGPVKKGKPDPWPILISEEGGDGRESITEQPVVISYAPEGRTVQSPLDWGDVSNLPTGPGN